MKQNGRKSTTIMDFGTKKSTLGTKKLRYMRYEELKRKIEEKDI